MSKPLTEKQKAVIEFIKDCQSKGYTPTRKDMAEHFGWKSLNSADTHINFLKRKGAIEIIKNTTRITVLI